MYASLASARDEVCLLDQLQVLLTAQQDITDYHRLAKSLTNVEALVSQAFCLVVIFCASYSLHPWSYL
jgi:hypothetical protein